MSISGWKKFMQWGAPVFVSCLMIGGMLGCTKAADNGGDNAQQTEQTAPDAAPAGDAAPMEEAPAAPTE